MNTGHNVNTLTVSNAGRSAALIDARTVAVTAPVADMLRLGWLGV